MIVSVAYCICKICVAMQFGKVESHAANMIMQGMCAKAQDTVYDKKQCFNNTDYEDPTVRQNDL